MSNINIEIEDLEKLKIKYSLKYERYKLLFNEETERTIKKLKEIEEEIEVLKAKLNHLWNADRPKYSKYCPNYDSDLDK
jgi:hypothetical protein